MSNTTFFNLLLCLVLAFLLGLFYASFEFQERMNKALNLERDKIENCARSDHPFCNDKNILKKKTVEL